MVANLSQLSHPEVLIEGLRNLENQETTVAVLPFFHIYAMNCIMTFGLRLGGKLVTVPRFEPEMYISCLVNYKVSSMHTTHLCGDVARQKINNLRNYASK